MRSESYWLLVQELGLGHDMAHELDKLSEAEKSLWKAGQLLSEIKRSQRANPIVSPSEKYVVRSLRRMANAAVDVVRARVALEKELNSLIPTEDE